MERYSLTVSILFVLALGASAQSVSDPTFKPDPVATPTPTPQQSYQYIIVPPMTITPGRPVGSSSTSVKATDAPQLHTTPIWSRLGNGINGENKSSVVYYRDARRTSGGVELWMKFVLVKPIKTPYGKVAHTVEFVTIDCADRRYSTESIVMYGSDGRMVNTPSYWLRNAYRDPILPDSVMDLTRKRFCSR